ncbi:hypothetical protein QTN47_26165 [Danxiaibacter flavus]|uniref:Uncharacterized protein n=1 Tax=Danxiaibacter flavus TaxID=3049108 RepID=A0ABV3ZP90_9BACT|nr:hypothetical protein QNM32_26165 [Chitinophagaceae bacterium DXS]
MVVKGSYFTRSRTVLWGRRGGTHALLSLGASQPYSIACGDKKGIVSRKGRKGAEAQRAASHFSQRTQRGGDAADYSYDAILSKVCNDATISTPPCRCSAASPQYCGDCVKPFFAPLRETYLLFMTNMITLLVIFAFMGNASNKRVVTIHWKNRKDLSFEVFSNLKNLCLSYPEYNYNTLNNYLSKAKTHYENDDVRIERKDIIVRPKQMEKETANIAGRIVPVVRRFAMKDANEHSDDLAYWLAQPAAKRVAAVTFIISQSLGKDDRMNKKIVNKQKIKG